MIELVEQPRSSNLCGQACVAMLAGVTLDEAIKVVGTRGKTTSLQLGRGLAELGHILCGCVLIRGNPEKIESSEPILVRTHYFSRYTGKELTHWVVVHREFMFCPTVGLTPLHDLSVWVKKNPISWFTSFHHVREMTSIERMRYRETGTWMHPLDDGSGEPCGI
mgnify:CR=1 FL=1